MEGAEQTGPDDDSERDGAAPSRFSSETVTRKGMKQDTEPEPPSMVANFNHLLAETRSGDVFTESLRCRVIRADVDRGIAVLSCPA